MKVKTITFPRRITESLPQRVYFTNLSLVFLCALLISLSVLSGIAYIALAEAKGARAEITDNFNYWRGISEKHPNSPDAFYEAGFYAAELGDKSKAQKFIDEALRLDPSFEKAKRLSQQLTTDN